MKPSTLRAQQGRASVGKIVLALIVAAVLGGLAAGPALSDDHDQRNWNKKRGHPVYRPAPRYYSQPYGYVQPYGYYQAPPPVVYVPPPSPGISLFFGCPHR